MVRGLDWLQLEQGVILITLAGATQVLAAMSLAVVGVLYIVRPQTSWAWAGAALAVTWALIVGADFAAAGFVSWTLENSGLWTVVAAMAGLYAYHCHVPGYGIGRTGPSAETDSRAAHAKWRVWAAGGSVVGVVTVGLFGAYASNTETRIATLRAPPHSTQPSNTSKKPTATWASFATGANLTPTILSDGLQITDVQTGTGRIVRIGDVLSVRYIMWLGNRQQADSSDAEGGPFQFTLGTGMVIKGWDEGVPGMRVGGIRRLVIPPPLAYGAPGVSDASGAYVVPPNTTLVFIIELISAAPTT